jgi:pseudouridine-5'-phosphate glycosidase
MQETLGVPVVTYGENQDFPAFYSPSSGFKVGVYFALFAFLTRLDSLGFRAHGELMIQLPLQTFFVRGI